MNKPTVNHYENVRKLATLLDSQFTVLGIPIGLDPIIGLFPGGGDIIALIFSCYLLFVAQEVGLPADKQRQMVVNILLDFFLGLIPIAGDIVDVFYRSNQKNAEILLEHGRKTGV